MTYPDDDNPIFTKSPHIMSDEYTLEQEITLLQQDYVLLNETLADLRRVLKTGADQHVQRQITHIEAELADVKQQLEQLKKNTLSVALEIQTTTLANLYYVQNLPPHIIVQVRVFNELKAKLVAKPSLAETTEGQKKPLLLQASTGMGKSIMASVLAHDLAIRRTFVNGIFWFKLGRQPNLLAYQTRLAQILTGQNFYFTDTKMGNQQLRKICQDKACLIILDDVWDVQDVIAFNNLGTYCQLFVTTCDNTLLGFIKNFTQNVQGHILEVLSKEQANEFLTYQIGYSRLQSIESLDIQEMLYACHHVPLALKMVSNLIKSSQSIDYKQLIRKLKNPNNKFPGTQPQSLMQALHLTIELLEERGEYYLALAVFTNYTHIPQTTIILLWRYLYAMTEEQAINFIKELAEKDMLHWHQDSEQGDHISLHAFQHDYLCVEADLEKLHSHLLTAYRRYCHHGWAHGPDDGYFFQNLCHHLLQAGWEKELKSLLLDFDWLQQKLAITTIHDLIADYELLSDLDLVTVKQGLLKALPILIQDKEQLATQLLKYLWHENSSDIHILLNQAQEVVPDWVIPV